MLSQKKRLSLECFLIMRNVIKPRKIYVFPHKPEYMLLFFWSKSWEKWKPSSKELWLSPTRILESYNKFSINVTDIYSHNYIPSKLFISDILSLYIHIPYIHISFTQPYFITATLYENVKTNARVTHFWDKFTLLFLPSPLCYNDNFTF